MGISLKKKNYEKNTDQKQLEKQLSRSQRYL
jgi:hypothetical protein